MVNAQQCKDCDHVDVCGKKSQYQNFISKIENTIVEKEETSYLYAKGFKDATVDIHCSYFKPQSRHYISFKGGDAE